MWNRADWVSDSAARRTLLFPGATDLLVFLDELRLRPRPWWREEKDLPIVVLAGGRPDRSPVLGVEKFLSVRRLAVIGAVEPKHEVRGEAEVPESDVRARRYQVAQLLEQAVTELSSGASGGRRVRFPHYAVAGWLASLLTRDPRSQGVGGRPRNRSGGKPDRPNQRLEIEFREFIRMRYQSTRVDTAAHEIAVDLPWWIRLAVQVLPFLGLLLIRGVWSAPRWFRKQEVGTLRTGSFSGLARTLADAPDDGTHDDVIRALLVDAFLQDLRRAWRRRSFFGAGRRRVCYPVLLLRRQPDSDVVERFLELVVACRDRQIEARSGNLVQRWDPLLIVTGYSAGDPLPDMVQGQPTVSPLNSQPAYLDWRRTRAAARANEREQPLVITIRTQYAAPGDIDGGLAPDEDGLLRNLGLIRSRRLVPPVGPYVAVMVLLAAVLVGGVGSYMHCGGVTWSGTVDRADSGECVGVATNGYRFFAELSGRYGQTIDSGLADSLADVEQKISEQNDRVAVDPAHRTIVYLSVLTPRDPQALVAEQQQIRGLYVAQTESLGSRSPLRILLANTGDDLGQAVTAVDAVGRAARSDSSIVAVTGLGISLDATGRTISQLAGLRLATVGTLLSATSLATSTPQYYHQVGPTNAREAAVGAYAARQAQNAMVVYSGDSTDRYSSDLANKFAGALKVRGAEVTLSPYESTVGAGDGLPVGELGQDACRVPRGPSGLVFYAGRSEKLMDFLGGLKASCEGTYPRVMLGDDVNRFAVQTGFRDYPGLDVRYLAFASSLSWPGSNCEGARAASGFYEIYMRTFNDCGSTRDGTAAVGYDAGWVVRQAIERARADTDTPPTSDLVLGQINAMTPDNSVVGATGRIQFDKRYGNGRLPVDKAIVVLGSNGGGPPTESLLCGELASAKPSADPACPTD